MIVYNVLDIHQADNVQLLGQLSGVLNDDTLMNLTSTPNISIAISIVIELIAIAIAILFLVCMFIDSQPGENKWGPNPKEPTQIETTE